MEGLLLLLYKKDLLTRALLSEEAWSILAPLGYPHPCCLNAWLERLAMRFDGDFPHEIGLFLGYPPEDVRGFIQDRGRSALASGYWKVYGNVVEAKQTFKKFRRAEHEAARALIRQSYRNDARASYYAPQPQGPHFSRRVSHV
jgi:hypothetical protein